jgi:hypothetical protein
MVDHQFECDESNRSEDDASGLVPVMKSNDPYTYSDAPSLRKLEHDRSNYAASCLRMVQREHRISILYRSAQKLRDEKSDKPQYLKKRGVKPQYSKSFAIHSSKLFEAVESERFERFTEQELSHERN